MQTGYRAGTVGTAVVFGQQPSGLIPAARAASRHVLTNTFGSLDTDAARISRVGPRLGPGGLGTLFGDPGVGFLHVQRALMRS
jgi:hypothetical protein